MNTLEQTLTINHVSFKDGKTLILTLSNKRAIEIPLDEYPEIAMLSSEEKDEFQIMDGEYLSFVALDEIYSLKDLIGYKNQ